MAALKEICDAVLRRSARGCLLLIARTRVFDGSQIGSWNVPRPDGVAQTREPVTEQLVFQGLEETALRHPLRPPAYQPAPHPRQRSGVRDRRGEQHLPAPVPGRTDDADAVCWAQQRLPSAP